MLATWRRKAWNFPLGREMEPTPNPLVCVDPPHHHFSNCNDSDSSEPADTRPSILITFQNSASYYTSYMGSGGHRGGGGGGSRRRCSDVQIQPPQQQQQQQKEHPIVIMNEYPSPPPVSVAVSSRKMGFDPVFKAFSGPPMPQGPPKPPGPPMPNVPPISRRESINTTLELPKSRRSSLSPSVASSRNRSPSTQSRVLLPNNMPPNRPHGGAGRFESTTLPRKMKVNLPRNSQSMPTLSGDLENENLEPLSPSPRPSVCSSGAAHSQGERRPLMHEQRSSQDMEDWTPPTQPKPNWLFLNPNSNNERKDCRTQSVYVAEIWPSLVCILTAVLMTLILYILVSYFYSVPHPTTRNSIAPSLNRPTQYPPPPTAYPYPYPPYVPPPYDRYPPYHYPPHPSSSNP